MFIHPADGERLRITFREALASRARPGLIALLTRPLENARPIDDGQEFPALGGLRVIHTPGHTPGSVCLYGSQHRVLIVGDMLQVFRGRLMGPSAFFSDDVAMARRSLSRLAELDVETICLAHYPPWRLDARRSIAAVAEGG
ncbi:MAG: MBL fold metallo-hydrolase [Candidatus Limnocylindria bacterium]